MRVRTKDFTYVTGKKYDGMMARCYRVTDKSYKYYNSLGIRVHSEWIKDINNFRDWIRSELERLQVTEEEFVNNSKLYTLDRINTLGHYTPENCRLVSMHIQGRNRVKFNSRILISAEGEEISI